MKSQFRAAFAVFAMLSITTGVAYPLLVTAVAQVAFPYQANGSLIENKGSALLGQPFDDLRYFWGRPSATSPTGYNATSSSGSNLGPTNPAQLDAVKARVELLRKMHPYEMGPVPVDLVTASASGLDPHISPAAAEYQVGRVAVARKLSADKVRQLVARYTTDRSFGILGEPCVNVLLLNIALDEVDAGSR